MNWLLTLSIFAIAAYAIRLGVHQQRAGVPVRVRAEDWQRK